MVQFINTEAEILALSSEERLAGFLYWTAKVAFIGAVLRTKYKDTSTDYSEGWSPAEEAEWEQVVDEHEKWFYATPLSERGGIVLIAEKLIFNQLAIRRLPIENKEKILEILG